MKLFALELFPSTTMMEVKPNDFLLSKQIKTCGTSNLLCQQKDVAFTQNTPESLIKKLLKHCLYTI